ncbi:MAG: salicylate hydroxylase [Rhodoferax sp.]|nr:salicylate hydroxylase [Rhodoferax sp.]
MVDMQTWFGIQQLYADYAIAVDSGKWNRWPEFFTEQCVYKVQPRENFERGFPLATLALTSKDMLKDRVYGITETIYHDPYYQRHVVGAPMVRKVEDGRIHSEANYAVFRTKYDKVSTVFNVGRYIDTIVHTPEGFKFAERICVYDSEMIPNSLIYPI